MPEEKRPRVCAPMAVGGLAALLLLLHCVREIDSDEGVILHGAWSILNGRRPYTDFFEFVAPAGFYLVAGIWRAVGDGYWTAKFIGIAAIGAAAVAVHRTAMVVSREARHPAGPGTALLAPGLLILFSATWPTINHNTFHVALAAWGAYFLVRTLQRGSLKDAALAGTLSGLAILMLQHKGIAFAATASLFLVARAISHRDTAVLGRCTLTFVATAALPVMATLFLWPASVLYEDLVAFPASHYFEVNRTSMEVVLYAATFVLIACWRLRASTLPAVQLLVCLQVVLLVTAFQRPDMCHVTQSLLPVLSLAPLWVNPASGRSRSLLALLCVSGFFALAMPAAAMRAAYVLYADVIGEPSDLALEYASRHCKSAFIYAGPFEPGVYYELRKLNPTRFSFLLSGMNTAAQFGEAAADLAASRPSCAVLNRSKVLKYSYDWSNPVDDYIRANYALAVRSGNYEAWTERPQGGRGAR